MFPFSISPLYVLCFWLLADMNFLIARKIYSNIFMGVFFLCNFIVAKDVRYVYTVFVNTLTNHKTP